MLQLGKPQLSNALSAINLRKGIMYSHQYHKPTIGIDFVGKNVTLNQVTCRLQLWDTAGQERYRSLIPSYLKDAICAIFVFDVTRTSFFKTRPGNP